MSVRMRKSPKHDDRAAMLRFSHAGKLYVIPKLIAEKYIVCITKTESTVPAEQVFSDLTSKLTKAGALLKGLRTRENLTQAKFAAKIGVTQANLSKMENGKRPIGKIVAKRISKVFAINYRYFLE